MNRLPSNVIVSARVSSHCFTYQNKIFVTEISSLSARGANPFGRIYNDACDTGFIMVSEKTREEAIFFVCDEVRDSEGELQYLVMRPLPETIRRLPKLDGVLIHAFND